MPDYRNDSTMRHHKITSYAYLTDYKTIKYKSTVMWISLNPETSIDFVIF